MTIFKRTLLISFAILTLAFLLSPNYFKRALIHTTADIDDYKLFENREIEVGEAEKWQVSATKSELNNKQRKYIESLNPVAFLVSKSKEIVYEEYWDGYDENSYSNSFSMAKSIISLLIGIAIDEGKIEGVDQKVKDFIPEFRKSPNQNLSIKALLNMSSGLNWDESYGNPFSATTKAYYGEDLESLMLELKVESTSNQKFKYLSANTEILAMILRKATGKQVSEYASEKLWKPIGAENPALWSIDKKDGLEKAYCCFNSNARDFAKIGQLVLNKGSWNGKQIISESYLKEATNPASYLEDKKGKSVNFYGYQWWILQVDGQKIPFCRGILGQYIFVIPEKDAVVVRLGHDREKTMTNHIPDDAYEYVKIALEIL